MLIQSQPIDPEFAKKMGLSDDNKNEWMLDDKIESQFIGEIFEDLLEDAITKKISLKIRLEWKRQSIKDVFYKMKYTIRNHVKWHRVLCDIRPWEGYHGLINVMRKHLTDYLETEEKYGHSLKEYRDMKIQSVKETLDVLKCMENPDDYWMKRRDEVELRYPIYKSLITKYEKGGTCISGDFVAQGDGWVGMESGNDPREGYFEFYNGLLELKDSPDKEETDRLIAEVHQYQTDLKTAYENAEKDSDEDLEHLYNLLKENLYSWWD